MRQEKRLGVLLLLVQAATRTTSAGCPSQCSCDRATGKGVDVRCDGGGLTDGQLQKLLRQTPPAATALRLIGQTDRPNAFSVSRDFARLRQLTRLELVNCGLRTLGVHIFSRLPRLRELNVADNRVEHLSSETFEECDMLELLDMSKNRLGSGSLPTGAFGKLHRLRWLSLADNGLRQLPSNVLGRATLLSTLILDGNRLSATSIKALTADARNLERLELNRCGLTSIDADTFAHVPLLGRLGLAHNDWLMVAGPLNLLPRLNTLDLSANNLTYIPRNAFVGTDMATVSFAFNQLGRAYDANGTRVDGAGIHPLAFQHHGIKAINLSYNDFTTFHSDMLGDSAETLKTLDVSGNPLCNVLAHMTATLKLRSLHLSDIGLQSLKRLPKEFERLADLDLSRNDIDAIPPDVTAQLGDSLRTLDLSHCRFRRIPKYLINKLFSRLERVHLDGNPLDCHCHAMPLRDFLQGHAAGEEGAGPRCATPPSLHGRALLQVERAPDCAVLFGASTGLTQRSELGILAAAALAVLLGVVLATALALWTARLCRQSGTYRTREQLACLAKDGGVSSTASSCSGHFPPQQLVVPPPELLI